MLTASLDTSGLNAVCREISAQLGKLGAETTVARVVRAEAGAILAACVKRTPSGKTDRIILGKGAIIQRKFNTYSGGRAGQSDKYIKGTGISLASARGANPLISLSNGKTWFVQGGIYYVMKGPGQWGGTSARHQGARGSARTLLHQRAAATATRISAKGAHWPDALWAKFQTEEAERIRDRSDTIKQMIFNVRRARGLGKQSWIQCAEDLKLTLPDAPGYAKDAIPSTGKRYKNGVASEVADAGTYILAITNSSPIAVAIEQSQGVLRWAIAGREQFYVQNVARGVLDSLEKIARAYPFLKLQ